MKFIAWNKRKTWKPKQYEITAELRYYHTTSYSCSYVVNSVHEYFAVTDSHLQISHHQASLKHENFVVSYHSYTTLLPQNILQLQLHFSWTLYNFNNLMFTKLRWVGIVGYCYMFLIYNFSNSTNIEWGCFNSPKFDSGYCNLTKYL